MLLFFKQPQEIGKADGELDKRKLFIEKQGSE